MKYVILLLALAVSLLSGCSTVQEQFRSKERNYSIRFMDSNAERISKKYFSETSDANLDTLSEKFRDHINKSEDNEAKSLRDNMIYDLLMLSDYIYERQKDAYFNGKATFDTYFKIADLALTGTAATFGNASSKSTLSAAATFLTGTKLSVDENFYAKQSISTIITNMDGNRSKVRIAINKAISDNKAKPASDFRFSEAISLVQRYHRAGSLIDAVVDLNRSAAADADKAKEQLEKQELGDAIAAELHK